MNLKTTALVGLCVMLAALAMSPTASAMDSDVHGCVDFPGATCGAAQDSWVAIWDDYGNCATSHVVHPTGGC